LSGLSQPGTEEALQYAHRARLALEKIPRRPDTRALAFFIASDLIGPHQENEDLGPLLRYARYRDGESIMNQFVEDGEPLPPKFTHPDQLLGG
jgi:hypothetical protein